MQDWYSEETATFGDRLAGAREAAQLSQEELAERVGVKLRTLRDWEDDNNEPRVNRLVHLAGILGVSFRWLLTGEGQGVQPPGDAQGGAPDTAVLLGEISAVRAQLAQTVDRLGLLEKRLRGSDPS